MFKNDRCWESYHSFVTCSLPNYHVPCYQRKCLFISLKHLFICRTCFSTITKPWYISQNKCLSFQNNFINTDTFQQKTFTKKWKKLPLTHKMADAGQKWRTLEPNWCANANGFCPYFLKIHFFKLTHIQT